MSKLQEWQLEQIKDNDTHQSSPPSYQDQGPKSNLSPSEQDPHQRQQKKKQQEPCKEQQETPQQQPQQELQRPEPAPEKGEPPKYQYGGQGQHCVHLLGWLAVCFLLGYGIQITYNTANMKNQVLTYQRARVPSCILLGALAVGLCPWSFILGWVLVVKSSTLHHMSRKSRFVLQLCEIATLAAMVTGMALSAFWTYRGNCEAEGIPIDRWLLRRGPPDESQGNPGSPCEKAKRTAFALMITFGVLTGIWGISAGFCYRYGSKMANEGIIKEEKVELFFRYKVGADGRPILPETNISKV